MTSSPAHATRPALFADTAESLAVLGVKPAVTPENKPLWDAAAEGRLIVERCEDCGLHLFPPHGICRRCLGCNLAWVDVNPPGVVKAYTINHHPWAPGLGPYAVALVEMPEYDDIRMVGVLHGLHREPDIGDRVDFDFTPFRDGICRLGFTPWRIDAY